MYQKSGKLHQLSKAAKAATIREPGRLRRFTSLQCQSDRPFTAWNSASSPSKSQPHFRWSLKSHGGGAPLSEPNQPASFVLLTAAPPSTSPLVGVVTHEPVATIPEPCAPDDLEAVNDPEAVAGLKAAAHLEALGVKAKHKFRGREERKQDQALDDPEAVGGLKATTDLEALGVKAKLKFRGREERKLDQVGLGTKSRGPPRGTRREGKTQISWTRRTKTRPSGTWNQKVEDDLEAVNDPEALDDPEVVADPKAVADPRAVGGHALGLSPQGRPNSTPPWRPRALATQHFKAENPRQRR
nr:hypothetical protein Iba_chr02bCG14950 [Ipomoea batatas]